ncbi:hypothetical protein [Sanguibacteroides justesenii]|uniref:hypothetical protein n=1 Tax=Sanguibacteroides justesenii TaxID=1547597 RepID=UPI001F1C8133|nr:hypothetical protein [Sanguibacteroides justesenii]
MIFLAVVFQTVGGIHVTARLAVSRAEGVVVVSLLHGSRLVNDTPDATEVIRQEVTDIVTRAASRSDQHPAARRGCAL